MQQKVCVYVLQVVSRGGNVMLPVDASGRLLELLLVLEKLMQDNKWVHFIAASALQVKRVARHSA